ncbi:hypothetical protein MLD38_004937 [Melastoma candidum]|uniref:Uncharacterized protein n=1 Tax=Melastoma candidum TaxID=119954 RepID=A0ACB9S8L6_9MYRT|nr:hypothetical protein MLD38_004937 [Melastoma candidum]
MWGGEASKLSSFNQLRLLDLKFEIFIKDGGTSWGDISYFEDRVLSGNWDEIESYLSGFIKHDDNPSSTSIFLEIRKQKYMKALDDWMTVATSQRECLKEGPLEFACPITDATCSCDGQLIYTSFLDASVCTFDTATKRLGIQLHLLLFMTITTSPVRIAAC